jgi:tetratricopeptide (TPR) repeat protein
MNPIRAFVGHSFSSADQGVNAAFLKYLTDVAETLSNFSWEHAEGAEPKDVREKVLARLEDKNLFIGICTRKERAIADAHLKKPWYSDRLRIAADVEFEWKTSDWIIQEIGLAVGRGMDLILLVEEGVRAPGGLQGDIEYIPFNREAPERSFGKLLQMLAALSPKATHPAVLGSTSQAVPPDRTPPGDPQADVSTLTPSPDWTRDDCEYALIKAIFGGNTAAETAIEQHFLVSAHGRTDDERASWNAFTIHLRIVSAKGGRLVDLQRLATDNPSNYDVHRYLAYCYLQYEEQDKAAQSFLAASHTASTVEKKIKMMGEAIEAFQRAKQLERVDELLIEMRDIVARSPADKNSMLKTELTLAELRGDDYMQTACMEQLLEIQPDDHELRFSLAYKYSQISQEGLALFHYLRIPAGNRSAIAWNNLGVSYLEQGMPINAISAYRQAEQKGETLAMSNLAKQLLQAGFVDEATKTSGRALAIEEHHENVDLVLAQIKGASEGEQKKEAEILNQNRPVAEFNRKFAAAVVEREPSVAELSQSWQGPSSRLTLVISGEEIQLTGSYEVANALAGGLLSFAPSSPAEGNAIRYAVTYRATFRGRACIGSFVRRRLDSAGGGANYLTGEADPSIRMYFSEDGTRIEVMEAQPKGQPKFYSIRAL